MRKFIYALKCPITNQIHYIGKTSVGMTRPLQHLRQSHSDKINEWVDSLKKFGEHPVICILENVLDFHDINNREKFWISESIKNGDLLLNETLVTAEAIIPNIDERLNAKEFDGFASISKTVRYRRRQTGLTQKQFSEKTSIAITVVRKIKQGNSGVTLRSLLRVLDIFGLTITSTRIKL